MIVVVGRQLKWVDKWFSFQVFCGLSKREASFVNVVVVGVVNSPNHKVARKVLFLRISIK